MATTARFSASYSCPSAVATKIVPRRFGWII